MPIILVPSASASAPAIAGAGMPNRYAVQQMGANSVTILMDCTPTTGFTLYADGISTADTLSGSDEPAFSESYHDILISAVLIDEYLKLEKPALSKIEDERVYGNRQNTHGRMGELRHWIAVSTTKKEYQGKLKNQQLPLRTLNA